MPRHPPCALNNLTNTHIKKSRHKCAQKQKMLASTVQFSTTTRTEAAPTHRRSRPRPSLRDNAPHPTGQRLSSQDPTVCRRPSPQQRRPDCPVFPLFSSNPLPPPHRPSRPRTGRYWGPPPHHHSAQNTRLRTPRPVRCSVKLLRKE